MARLNSRFNYLPDQIFIYKENQKVELRTYLVAVESNVRFNYIERFYYS